MATGKELIVTKDELLANPNVVPQAVAQETAVQMEKLAATVVEISQLCAAVIVYPDGSHPTPPSLDPRSFSISPRATKELAGFMARSDSYGKVLGISSALMQPVSRLVHSLRVAVKGDLARGGEDNTISWAAKKAYVRALGVPQELVDLVGNEGPAAFYLRLAHWWAEQVVAAQGAYEAAVKAMADQERRMGRSADMAESYGMLFTKMEAERAATYQQITTNTDAATGRDVVASVGSGSDAAIKNVTGAAAALRQNLRLYEKFDKTSLAALRAQLEVGRQSRNAPYAEQALEHLRRVVEARLKMLFLCVNGLDLPLVELQGMLLAGMADMAEFQLNVLRGAVDLQAGLLAAASGEFESSNRAFEQQLLNVGRTDVVEGEFVVVRETK